MHSQSRALLATATGTLAVLIAAAPVLGEDAYDGSATTLVDETQLSFIDTSELRSAVTADGVRAHQRVLQEIADRNGGIRSAGTPGYDESADYVREQLLGAGYVVTVQPFDAFFFEEVSAPSLEQILPNPTNYPNDESGFITMRLSGGGDITAPVEAVDVIIPPAPDPNTSTSACEAEDFSEFTPGNIALVQRGTCAFVTKVQNAQAAGAAGVILFNEGQPTRTEAFQINLGEPFTIQGVMSAFEIGEELYNLASQGSGVSVRMVADVISEVRQTTNVIAERPVGRQRPVVLVGAHLDSVQEGPGINDNGSGVATILEIALRMAEVGFESKNRVRFAFWGDEESGLRGSQHYADNLSPRDIQDIGLNLNFDMLGSPNYVRFVYDGDGSDTPDTGPGPNGSAAIERVFVNFFNSLLLPTDPTAFDGRSDYGPFIALGIPAGGLFSGAEGLKTEEQARTYGGTADEPYDPCYHEACDDFSNNNAWGLVEMSNAATHAVVTFANAARPVNRPTMSTTAARATQSALDYRGHWLQR